VAAEAYVNQISHGVKCRTAVEQPHVQTSIVAGGRGGEGQSQGVSRQVEQHDHARGSRLRFVVEPHPQFRVGVLTPRFEDRLDVTQSIDVAATLRVEPADHVGVDPRAGNDGEP
jgi:hypothetical protein